MTRAEAAAMLVEWNALCWKATVGPDPVKAKLLAIALEERIIDAMTGEEATQPLAGNAP